MIIDDDGITQEKIIIDVDGKTQWEIIDIDDEKASQEEAEERKSLSLSFRHVNTFDLNTFSFKLNGLTKSNYKSCCHDNILF